jgi:hypothetical protein
MGNKSTIIGLGIVGIAAYLWFRGKGGNTIPAYNPIKEVEFRNLQKQEQRLTKELETDLIFDRTDIDYSVSRINAIEHTIGWLQSAVNQVRGINNTDIFVRTNAARQRKFYLKDLAFNQADLISQNEILKGQLVVFNNNVIQQNNEANQIISTQNFYNSATLNDIRQRLNSNEFV